MLRFAKRLGVELIWFVCACAVGMWFWMTVVAGHEDSTRAVQGLPPLQSWPDISYEWRFVVLLTPYVLSVVFRLAFGRAVVRLLDRPLGNGMSEHSDRATN